MEQIGKLATRVTTTVVMLALLSSSACDQDALVALFGGTAPQTVTTAVVVAEPDVDTTVAPGAAAVIRWADLADQAGTIVKIVAQRQNDTNEPLGAELTLVEARDAMEDGEGDIFQWDITGVRVGNYVVTATITAPDGTTASDEGDGFLIVTTALTVPTLTFTAPGATDETFNSGDTFAITWTDNGDQNAEARLLLGLDPDFDHDSGNEIVLLRDQLLSTDDANGSFSFTGVDENASAVAAASYVVFAIIDDGANDPVESDASGQLVIAP